MCRPAVRHRNCASYSKRHKMIAMTDRITEARMIGKPEDLWLTRQRKTTIVPRGTSPRQARESFYSSRTRTPHTGLLLADRVFNQCFERREPRRWKKHWKRHPSTKRGAKRAAAGLSFLVVCVLLLLARSTYRSVNLSASRRVTTGDVPNNIATARFRLQSTTRCYDFSLDGYVS